MRTHLPVIVDPSHAAGKRDARAAHGARRGRGRRRRHHRRGASATPSEALCDGPQQIPAGEFADFAHEIRALASLLGKTIG